MARVPTVIYDGVSVVRGRIAKEGSIRGGNGGRKDHSFSEGKKKGRERG